MKGLYASLIILTILVFSGIANGQEMVELTSTKDNTLYEDANGSVSNGAGIHMFAGKTNVGLIRRAILAFDIAGNIPTGATIDSVRLNLFMSKTPTGAGAREHNLYKVASDWGEGSSDASSNEGQGIASASNDATWIHSFFNTATWTTPGGDYSPSSRGALPVDGTGEYTWPSSSLIVQDVQSWLETPGENFGWILIGDESANKTAKRFDTRENSSASNRPRLTVYYSGVTGLEPALIESLNTRIYPNPFRSETTISLELNQTFTIELNIYNMLGQQIHQLYNGPTPAGKMNLIWDGRDSGGQEVNNGIYYCEIRIDTERKMIKLIKSK